MMDVLADAQAQARQLPLYQGGDGIETGGVARWLGSHEVLGFARLSPIWFGVPLHPYMRPTGKERNLKVDLPIRPSCSFYPLQQRLQFGFSAHDFTLARAASAISATYSTDPFGTEIRGSQRRGLMLLSTGKVSTLKMRCSASMSFAIFSAS